MGNAENLQGDEPSDTEKWAKSIKEIPTRCKYCGKKHGKDKIQYIQVLGDRKEPVCNKDCAIGLAEGYKKTYEILVDELTKRIEELKTT